MRRRGYGGRWLGGGIVAVGGAALIAAGPSLPGTAAERAAPAPVVEAMAAEVGSGLSLGSVETGGRVWAELASSAESAEAESPAVLDTQVGSASYYANMLAGRRTASGVRYDPAAAVAAHRELPFGTRLRVHNLANGRTVEVRVVDRGPFAKGRILDLSRSAARDLGFIRQGHTRVRIEVLEYGG